MVIKATKKSIFITNVELALEQSLTPQDSYATLLFRFLSDKEPNITMVTKEDILAIKELCEEFLKL